MIKIHEHLTKQVEEIGFYLVIEDHENNWDTRYIIRENEKDIYKTITASNISAWVRGYKYFCKEAWEI